MSRSYKKSPVFGSGRRSSAKWDKRHTHKKERNRQQMLIAQERWDDLGGKRLKSNCDTKWDWKEGQDYQNPFINKWCWCGYFRSSYGKGKNKRYYRRNHITDYRQCSIHKKYGSYERYLKENMRK